MATTAAEKKVKIFNRENHLFCRLLSFRCQLLGGQVREKLGVGWAYWHCCCCICAVTWWRANQSIPRHSEEGVRRSQERMCDIQPVHSLLVSALGQEGGGYGPTCHNQSKTCWTHHGFRMCDTLGFSSSASGCAEGISLLCNTRCKTAAAAVVLASVPSGNSAANLTLLPRAEGHHACILGVSSPPCLLETMAGAVWDLVVCPMSGWDAGGGARDRGWQPGWAAGARLDCQDSGGGVSGLTPSPWWRDSCWLLPLSLTPAVLSLPDSSSLGSWAACGGLRAATDLWAFSSPASTCEQCAFKTSRRAIVSPSLLLIVACFQPCFPVTFAGCEREQRCRSPARRGCARPVVPAGDGAAPGTAERRASTGSPASLSLGDTAGLATSLVLLSCPSPPRPPGRGLQPQGQTSGHPTLAGAPARGAELALGLCSGWCSVLPAWGCRGIACLPEHKVTATSTRLGLLLGRCPACLRSLLSGLTAEYLELLAFLCRGGTKAEASRGLRASAFTPSVWAGNNLQRYMCSNPTAAALPGCRCCSSLAERSRAAHTRCSLGVSGAPGMAAEPRLSELG